MEDLRDNWLPKVPDRFIVPVIVWATLAGKVKVLAGVVMFLGRLVKIVVPEILWSPPSSTTLPLLGVKVSELLQSPPTFIWLLTPDLVSSVPPVMVKSSSTSKGS